MALDSGMERPMGARGAAGDSCGLGGAGRGNYTAITPPPPPINNPIQNVLRELPAGAAERKATPILSGVLDYFPLAIAEVARISKMGNDQHNPGQPLHWARFKSTDHADCVVRHLIERGTIDAEGCRHTAKAAWRMLAILQEELELAAGWKPKGEVETKASTVGQLPLSSIRTMQDAQERLADLGEMTKRGIDPKEAWDLVHAEPGVAIAVSKATIEKLHDHRTFDCCLGRYLVRAKNYAV